MFRILTKLQQNHILWKKCQLGLRGIPALRPKEPRFYAKEPVPLCPPPKSKRDASTGTVYTVGALALVAMGTIGYAKYDPEFRRWIEENVPYSDAFFKFIFQEEHSFVQSAKEGLDNLMNAIGGDRGKRIFPPLGESKGDYIPPRAVFPSLIKEEKEEKFNEIRMQNEQNRVEIVAEKPKAPEEILLPTHPKNMADLEMKISEAAGAAIKDYNKALISLRDYNRDIEVVIEDSVEKLDPNIWTSLKKKTDTKNTVFSEAEKNAEEAAKKLKYLSELLQDTALEAPPGLKETVKRNIDRYMEDIAHAKEQIEDERKMADITEKYWKKVESARCHYIEELEILFPDIDISRKKLSLKQADLDLFILYAFANVLFYQKELHRVELVGQNRLKYALDAAKKGDPNFSVVEIHIQNEIEKEKRNLALEYQKRCLALRRESERELRHQLKCQAEAHQDHLSDMLIIRENELERDFNRKLDEEITKEQLKYKMQLAGMVGRMKGMRNAIRERIEADKIARQSQVLWSACQALHRAVKTSQPGTPWNEQIRPLGTEIEGIKKAAADSDELVRIVLAGIPEEAIERGVFPEDAIRERFLKVERVAKRIALVPEGGARLPLYLLSFIQSMLLIQAANPIPQSELLDEETDFSKLDTYDILQRARYWLDRGNYAQTLRYMNLLRGASRCIASDWMKETRILLETQQAAETLMAHAVAGGLAHL